MAHIILFGNEKGGSGKTTTAMHLIIGLLRLGFSVASIDLDVYQQSLSRYIENRKRTVAEGGLSLLLPEHFTLSKKSDNFNMHDDGIKVKSDEEFFVALLEQLKPQYDFIVIDTPGSHNELSKLAHSYADKVITPINDSFLDVDLIGHINPDKPDMLSPGVYSAMLFEQKLRRAARDKQEIDWLVIRNRLSTLDTINKKNVDSAIYRLGKKLGFRVSPGFGDRVIFKELFLNGLTLYDAAISPKVKISTSVLAARQELREFMRALQLQAINDLLINKRS
ncbi:Chromosome partitioning protein [Alphaproteobacteria bacterium]